MNLYEVNSASLAQALDVDEIPEIFVIVAKHQVMGLDEDKITEILGCSLEDLREVTKDELYNRVKGFCAGIQANTLSDQSSGWDALETIALKNLHARMQFEKDSEVLLKIAAVANKATRKLAPQNQALLDPSMVLGRRTITLTQRIVQKLDGTGRETQEETKQLSISDGSMVNPTFDEVNSLLTVRQSAILPKAMEVQTRTAEPTIDDVMATMNRVGAR